MKNGIGRGIGFREIRIRVRADAGCLLVGETGVHHISYREEALREFAVPVQGQEFKEQGKEVGPDHRILDTDRVHHTEDSAPAPAAASFCRAYPRS